VRGALDQTRGSGDNRALKTEPSKRAFMLAFVFMELFVVKGIRFKHPRQFVFTISLLLAFIVGGAVRGRAQYLVQADGENVQQRIARARALAAVGNLPAARSELESLSHVQADESVREIALVLLIGVYLEQSDYGYAEGLLNETFATRQAQRAEATHTYFALAGQVINGVRAHADRYRTLGLDVSDASLPTEATGDLEHLRALLERVVAQGKQLGTAGGDDIEAAALVEEAAGVRARLARNMSERAQWQREVSGARQRLAGTPAHMSVSNARPSASAPVEANAPAPAAVPTPTPTPVATPTVANTPAPVNSTAGAATTNAPSPAGTPTQPDTTKQAQTNTADATAQPLEVGAMLITKAKDKVSPSYPAQARTARVTGNVTVFLTVDEKGAVAEVKRTNGPELLRRAAEDAARRWKFKPTLVNGQPVRVAGYISFNFAL
jgi:TonB family protein